MIKELLSGNGLEFFSTTGLVLFTLIFLSIVCWVVARSRREVRDWASLPFESDEQQNTTGATYANEGTQ